MDPMAEPTTSPAPQPGTDQRLAKGARARASIARHAADVASVEGLTGVSIGRLAADLGLSKSGIATLFGTKEALQVAAVKSAREAFIERVIAPSMAQPRGHDRLRVLIDRWFDHITDPTFPGGCFRVATISEFDSKPGPVRDAIVEDRRDWLAFLAAEIRRAQEQGCLGDRNADVIAFEIEAIVSAANTAQQMGDGWGVATARAIVDGLLGEAPARG
jgi:AcrR family transcriptional regulator